MVNVINNSNFNRSNPDKIECDFRINKIGSVKLNLKYNSNDIYLQVVINAYFKKTASI